MEKEQKDREPELEEKELKRADGGLSGGIGGYIDGLADPRPSPEFELDLDLKK